MGCTMADFASKALEECTRISGMVCMLCKIDKRNAITVPGPSAPFMVDYHPRPVLPGSRQMLQVLFIITAGTALS